MATELETLISFGAQIRTNLETLSLLKKSRIDGMAGYCGLGSALLHKTATVHNIKTDFVLGTFKTPNRKKKKSGHCWVEFGDHIIDITASQFGINSRIYVSNIGDDRYTYVAKNDTAIFAIETCWPPEQKFSTYVEDIIVIAKTIEAVVGKMKEVPNVT
ncbi:MAG TPA: hypothetical protein VMX17_08935 [Candidatus Glassbacteria bacterium]|nr:hypothetical protein [Candidatus Glassbacteria bacterium]